MIFLDKSQMKSFEDINISIKVKLYCLKKLLFEKYAFENKNMSLKKNLKNFFFLMLFETKKVF